MFNKSVWPHTYNLEIPQALRQQGNISIQYMFYYSDG
jgi:hypothetical protein